MAAEVASLPGRPDRGHPVRRAAARRGREPGRRRPARLSPPRGEDVRDPPADRGRFQPGEHVVVIDDIVTDGASKLEAIEPLEAAGLVVEDLVVLVDREQGGRERLPRRAIASTRCSRSPSASTRSRRRASSEPRCWRAPGSSSTPPASPDARGPSGPISKIWVCSKAATRVTPGNQLDPRRVPRVSPQACAAGSPGGANPGAQPRAWYSGRQRRRRASTWWMPSARTIPVRPSTRSATIMSAALRLPSEAMIR